MMKRISRRLSRQHSDGNKKQARSSVTVLRKQNEELQQRVQELESAKPKNVWDALSDAISLGKQSLVDQIMNNPSFTKILESISPEEESDDASVGQEEEFEEVHATEEITCRLELRIEGLTNLPPSLSSAYYGRVQNLTTEKMSSTKFVTASKGKVKFDGSLKLGKVSLTDTLQFGFGNRTGIIGRVRVRVIDLLQQSSEIEGEEGFRAASLWCKDENDIFLFDKDFLNPTQLLVSVKGCHLPATTAETLLPPVEQAPVFAKHVVLVTRGTRGDVQPFIALARGLAEIQNYSVTIITEDRYRPLVERYSNVANGRVQFRSSGGDTEKRISTALAKWAMKQKSTALQMLMLGRSEREFFASEPMFFYWCRTLQPDLILYGFTTVNIAMILSESLQIPMVGFLLQPTVIPSKQYPAMHGIEKKGDPDASHRIHGRTKLFFEHNPLDFSDSLNSMRTRRGLKPFSHRTDNFQVLYEQNLPVAVPINKDIFGGRPSDWHKKAVLTDFIFLRTEAVPNLKARYVKMVMEAKAEKDPLVVLCFSSMPVARSRILQLSIKMIEECARSPRVIALVGNQNAIRPDDLSTLDSSAKELELTAASYIKKGKLLVDSGAPFSRLFPHADVVIAHGGLGTTGEILMAGKPCMTTGVLVLDQRFWGHRVHELGVGPAPVHIRDLHTCLVGNVDEMCRPGNTYVKKAQQLAAKLASSEEDDGVETNVKAIMKLVNKIEPVRRHAESITSTAGKLASAMVEDVNNTVREDVDFARGQITSMVVQNAMEIRTLILNSSSSRSNSAANGDDNEEL